MYILYLYVLLFNLKYLTLPKWNELKILYNFHMDTILSLLIECCQIAPNSVELERLAGEITDWDALIALASRHGILPLAYHALREIPTVPAHIKEGLKEQNRQIAMHNMLMSAELLRIMGLLADHDIPALAFKGPVLSQMIYGDITMRQYGDLDILVDEKDLKRGVEILTHNGYTPLYHLNDKQFQAYQSIAHDFGLINQKNESIVELHWKLLSSEFIADIEHIDFFENASMYAIQGKQIQTLGLEKLLLYLCIHGAKHQWERLEWLVDIALLSQNQSIDWKKLIDLTHLTHSEKMVFSAYFLCHHLLQNPIHDEIKTNFNQPKIKKISQNLERHFIKHFTDSVNVSTKTKTISLIQFQLLYGAKNKMLFLLSLFKPTQLDYLSCTLPNKLLFVYYLVRPFNILKRWSKKLVLKTHKDR